LPAAEASRSRNSMNAVVFGWRWRADERLAA
jgi:hypothetical protein